MATNTPIVTDPHPRPLEAVRFGPTVCSTYSWPIEELLVKTAMTGGFHPYANAEPMSR
jgi:hypothetical protein